MQITNLKMVQTDIGRGRAWIRLALNENSLESYLGMFASDPESKPQFYSKYTTAQLKPFIAHKNLILCFLFFLLFLFISPLLFFLLFLIMSLIL